jgi:Lipocalin-like domain
MEGIDMTAKRLLTIGLIAVIGWSEVLGPASAQTNRDVRAQIVGAWQLESRTVRDAGGRTQNDPVLGETPAGLLFYDASGHVSLQMMRQGRSQPISRPSNPREAANARIVLGYDSYFGTFRVDEAAGLITHHVEGSLFPEDLGKDFPRRLTVQGDVLTLSFTSKSAEGAEITRTLRFRRLPAR